jgi:predicted NodU family carbamoyl transferase
MSNALAISLGHNSSAVLIQDGRVVAGYEEERFTGVKSDSRYPIHSITELHQRYNLPKDTDIYVGHWFTDAHLPAPNKYWEPEHIRSLFPHANVESLSADFTHHDSHLESAMVFAGNDFATKYHALVADGFGSFGEVISLYEVHGGAYRLIKRVFGFEKSLGMLYQYATAFMGMKMHNHEYKMLAYEVHIDEVTEVDEKQRLDEMALELSKTYLQSWYEQKLTNEFDPLTKIEALPNVQAHINKILSKMLVEMDMGEANIDDKRIVVSYFVQKVVELTMTTFVRMNQVQSLLVAGGLFYNVKLNHLLCNVIPGMFCAMPLAGDQGAAIGVYNAYKGDLVWPEHLYWGDRDIGYHLDLFTEKGITVVASEEEARDHIRRALREDKFVNLVRGRMEYGPRALCNTSCIAIPDKQVAMDINRSNNRTMEMPFAP